MNKQQYSEKLRDPRWQKKRLEIMQRDNWSCLRCTDSKVELNIHHKEYSKTGNPWDVEDVQLETVCKECHTIIEAYKANNSVIFKIVKKAQHIVVYSFLADGHTKMMDILLRTPDRQSSYLASLSVTTIEEAFVTIQQMSQSPEKPTL